MPQAIRNLARLARGPRRGSVLILVVALLVLIALMGTAFLTSTQQERYTSVQNGQNTAADLQLQAVMSSVDAAVTSGLYGSTTTGTVYRPTSQEMPTYVGTYDVNGKLLATPMPGTAGFSPTTGYVPMDAIASDAFLSSRIPGLDASLVPMWNSVSWPLFNNSAQAYTLGTPAYPDAVPVTATRPPAPPITSLPTAYKQYLQFYPTSTTINGQVVPGGVVYLSAIPTAYASNTQGYPTATGCFTPTGYVPGVTPAVALATPADILPAADTDGDGIADAVLFPIPGGPVAGVTYYAAYRVVDGNSALNLSTAWSSDSDYAIDGTALPQYGFFRSGVGLLEMMNPGYASAEISQLNAYRLSGAASGITEPVADSVTTSPTLVARADFDWYSVGDVIEQQLARRPGNPGYRTTSTSSNFQTYGAAESASLAHRSVIQDPSATGLGGPEFQLAYDLTNKYSGTATNPNVVTTAFAPGDTTKWFNGQFNFQARNAGGLPLRSVLTASNAVSTAVPTWLGNAASPTVWTPGASYAFGDWVTEVDPAGVTGQRSYVCLLPHVAAAANEPKDGTNVAAAPYWAGILTSGQANVKPGVPWTRQVVKTSVNTAPFEQLWLAFCQVMTDSAGYDFPTTGGPTPGTAATGTKQWLPPLQPTAQVAPAQQQLPMFRSVTRGTTPLVQPTVRLTPSQMLKVRAALAAVNTIDLRDGDDDVTSRRIILTDPTSLAAPPARAYDVEVFGTEAQPYIGAVFVHVDPQVVTSNFVAVQFVNPYPQAITINPMTGWKLGTVTRSQFPNLTMSDMTTPLGLTAAVMVPGRSTTTGKPGLAVLQSGTPPAGYVPPVAVANQLTVTTTTGLEQAIGSELFLMKPRRSIGASAGPSKRTVPSGGDPLVAESYDETKITDEVPVDQIDLSALAATAGATAPVDYYYRRGTDPTALAAWNFVYPGRYPLDQTPLPAQPWFVKPAMPPAATVDPNMGGYYGYSATTKMSGDLTGTAFTTVPTFSSVPLVLNDANMGGPNRLAGGTIVAAAAPRKFPFGGFARQGDMLQVPFIGSYRIRALDPTTMMPVMSDATFVEMNSVTMDAALAEDVSAAPPPKSTPADTVASNYTEQIGRFCPVGITSNVAANPTATPPTSAIAATDDFNAAAMAYQTWHYHWGARLFDYLTVQAPADDYLPNVDPTVADAGVTPVVQAKYPGDATVVPGPAPVSNQHAGTENTIKINTSEDTVGTEGLVNINTAPVPVIAALPMLPGSANGAANFALATAIVTDRQANGPFASILDLYRVQAFRQANDTLLTTPPSGAPEPGPGDGIFAPFGIGTAAESAAMTGMSPRPRFDFQERFLILNRISNLITTRSDTFTCYVLVQGYRDVGVSGVTPTMVVQRRAAYLFDRNGVTPASRAGNRYPVPVN